MQKILLLAVILFIKILNLYAEYPYCFRFTWIGPFQDKNNIAGLTCEDLREDLTYIPCRRPLVATDNDTVPDTVDLWRRYRDEPNLFGCPMTPGQACVKYSYMYNKAVQNITYMCAKVNATNGCYRQKFISGLEIEVCVCESEQALMPCNQSAALHYSSCILINLFLINLLWLLFSDFYSCRIYS